MRINLFIIVALASTSLAQQYGDRVARQNQKVGAGNGYFYPEPSPSFTLPPPVPTTTRPPPPPPTQPVVVQTTPSEAYLPPAVQTTTQAYVPPVTTTQPSYARCSSNQECISAQSCNSRGSSQSNNGNCQIGLGGQVGVCCNPVPTTTPAPVRPPVTQPVVVQTTPSPAYIPPATQPSYVVCSSDQECVSTQVCSGRGSGSPSSGNCQIGKGGQAGVCCNRPTTTPAPITRPPTVRTTTPTLEYLPPTTTGYKYPEPEDPLQVPDSNNENPFVAQTVKPPPPTRPPVRPPTEPVLTAEEEEILFWDFRESIPGDPETDYPILDKIPVTSFDCKGKIDGFYADVETRCQVFHVCSNIPNSDPIRASFLCPNGTIFNQEVFVCQWWPDVNCATSSNFYSLNDNIGKVPEASSGGQIKISAGGAGPSISAAGSAISSSHSLGSHNSVSASAAVSVASNQY